MSEEKTLTEEKTSSKSEGVFWWIASIAVSVLCCAVLFVLFASYIVDIKAAIVDTGERINLVQQRDDRILSEIEMLRKNLKAAGVLTSVAPSTPGGAPSSLETVPPSETGTIVAPELPIVETPVVEAPLEPAAVEIPPPDAGVSVSVPAADGSVGAEGEKALEPTEAPAEKAPAASAPVPAAPDAAAPAEKK